MIMQRLRGWGVSIEKLQESGEDDLWVLVFTERHPPTGNEIRYEMNRETRDGVVRGLTDGIVLAGGALPKI